jgi:pimeloyl-ACP methyl ester carboxylesterase
LVGTDPVEVLGMKHTFTSRGKILLLYWYCALGVVSADRARSADPPPFTGEKSSWRGFDRYDFLMDETTFALTPYKAPAEEKTAVRPAAKGQLRCVVVVPKTPAAGRPWSWRGYYFDHEPQAEVELLKRGFHVGFVLADAGPAWDTWYAFLTEKHGLSTKPVFVGMSRGGRNAYARAAAHPDKVAAIYADNPAVARESLAKLPDLVKNDVPILHVCGSLDPLLGNHSNVVESIYPQLGGRISVMVKDGAAHHPHSLRDPKPIADFLEASVRSIDRNPPSFAGPTPTRTAFYGSDSAYREIPSEGTFVTCRGPYFGPCYDRYEFRLDGVKGAVTVIVPNRPAPGNPWVLRADVVPRDAVVDLALLDKGFHVVTGPCPTDTNGPVLDQWNAVYKHLTTHGLSPKPVLEGAGGAAGEAYAWAIANPDKAACIYAENPRLRSQMTKVQPLDNLAPLAKAGIPLLHVCGDRDPFLETHSRVLEKRYKELGGSVQVLIENGRGHLPTAPADPKPAVDFILSHQKSTEPTRDYRFDKTISRSVLENYLSRSISMEGLLNGRGDLADNVRMLKTTGAKFVGRALCLWAGEANLLRNLERAKQQVPTVHAADPEMILQACVFEIVTANVEQVPVPAWAFAAFGLAAETRNFRYADMLYPDGKRKDQWGRNASVPDISRPETKLWFYFLAASYIDLGCEAIHFGQAELMNGNDRDGKHWSEVLTLVRRHAAAHARRHLVLCDAHVPGGGLVRDDKLLFDLHSFPLRIKEIPDKPQEAELKLGFSDGIYNRSKGGETVHGWKCEHLPYLVEIDNWGASRQPGKAGQGGIWVWGYDEITWFAHQPKEYRAKWLQYAWDWVRQTDPNGYLQMPGSRTMRSPLDGKRWYHANNPGEAVPDGLGDEGAIRAVWATDRFGISSQK